LADNAGYDSSDLVSRLRAAHYEGKSTSGLGKTHIFFSKLKRNYSHYLCADLFNNKVADMRNLGITESFKLKRQVLLSATEAAEMILRVDDIIR
jgi:T-complex protein 1 subunit beta